MRRAAQILGLVALISSVQAHTVFTNFFVDGVGQGDGTCVRLPLSKDRSTGQGQDVTRYVDDVGGPNMVCGFNGQDAVAFVCPVKPASTFTFEFRHKPEAPTDFAIDASHKGPCSVYMKKVDSALKTPGAGDGWFKIFDEGYTEATQKWCTEKLNDNGGHLSVQIPSDLAGGYYLIRSELLALHSTGSPQFYVGCAQIFVQGCGSAKPATVSIPGHVSNSDPGAQFNIHAPSLALPYPIPGPKPYQPASTTAPTCPNVPTFSEGAIPSDCVLKNANWCAKEIPAYKNQIDCSAAKTNCFVQLSACQLDPPPITGASNCQLWKTHCDAITASCDNGATGPPDAGKILTPAVPSLSDAKAGPISSGGTVSPGGGTSGGGNGGSNGGSSSVAQNGMPAASSASIANSVPVVPGKYQFLAEQPSGAGGQNPLLTTTTVTRMHYATGTVHVTKAIYQRKKRSHGRLAL